MTLLTVFHGFVWGWAASLRISRLGVAEILLVLCLVLVACASGAIQAGLPGAAVAGVSYLAAIAAHRAMLEEIRAKGGAA